MNRLFRILKLYREIRKRGNAVKVIIDGENLLHSLKTLNREGVEIPEILTALKRFLKNDEKIGAAYYFETFRKEDLQQQSLRKELKRNGVKVVFKPAKEIIGGMRRKSRTDPAIIVEIMETGHQPDYGVVVLFSGDSDFEDPLRAIKKRGRKAVVVSVEAHLSRELRTVADAIIPLENLIAKSGY